MQILIKKIDETEPTTILNDVHHITESVKDNTITFSLNKDLPFNVFVYDKSKIEYFRKVGD